MAVPGKMSDAARPVRQRAKITKRNRNLELHRPSNITTFGAKLNGAYKKVVRIPPVSLGGCVDSGGDTWKY